MKLLVTVLFFAVMLLHLPTGEAWLDGNNTAHNFYFGKKNKYDKLIYTVQEVTAKSFLWKLSYNVTIPQPGVAERGIITYVEALDQDADGDGGYVYLKGGGFGYGTVTLHIESQWNKRVNFIINVYGV